MFLITDYWQCYIDVSGASFFVCSSEIKRKSAAVCSVDQMLTQLSGTNIPGEYTFVWAAAEQPALRSLSNTKQLLSKDKKRNKERRRRKKKEDGFSLRNCCSTTTTTVALRAQVLYLHRSVQISSSRFPLNRLMVLVVWKLPECFSTGGGSPILVTPCTTNLVNTVIYTVIGAHHINGVIFLFKYLRGPHFCLSTPCFISSTIESTLCFSICCGFHVWRCFFLELPVLIAVLLAHGRYVGQGISLHSSSILPAFSFQCHWSFYLSHCMLTVTLIHMPLVLGVQTYTLPKCDL